MKAHGKSRRSGYALFLVLLVSVTLPSCKPKPGGDVQVISLSNLTELARKGDASAQCSLGVAYIEGRGVPKNGTEGMQWFRKAADQGNKQAQSRLGFMYEKGRGVSKNYAEAVKWSRLAADKGHTQAQILLGTLYGKGSGVGKDMVESYKWIYLATGKGDTNAVGLLNAMEKHMKPEEITEGKQRVAAFVPKQPNE